MIEGKLNLSDDADYIIFDKGNSFNISELMNSMLLSKVRLHIEIDNKVLYSGEDKLKKQKKDRLWYFCCGKTDIDTYLWNNIGRKIKFGIKELDYEDESEDIK